MRMLRIDEGSTALSRVSGTIDLIRYGQCRRLRVWGKTRRRTVRQRKIFVGRDFGMRIARFEIEHIMVLECLRMEVARCMLMSRDVVRVVVVGQDSVRLSRYQARKYQPCSEAVHRARCYQLWISALMQEPTFTGCARRNIGENGRQKDSNPDPRF